jgi:diguanylate cyclase (GGDEF)-like protein
LLVRTRSLPLLDEGGKAVGGIGIFERVYEQDGTQILFKKLGQLAYLDPLTKIPNRRYLEDILNNWMQSYYIKSTLFSLVMLSVNQESGDFVLKTIAEALRHNLKSADVVGRWAEYVFLILLKSIPMENLEEKLESLKTVIENDVIAHEEVSGKVALSLGCAVPMKGDIAASLLARADELLRQSKRPS